MNEVIANKEFIYEFGTFVLDPHERILLAAGRRVHLTDKVFDTLLFLVRHNGRLLTKDEMITSIWDESIVEEGNLAKNISRLRKILNTGGSEMIETLPKHGYRFVADVNEIDGNSSLVVRRNLRVKITRTVSDEDERPVLMLGSSRRSRSRNVWVALAALSILTAATVGGYFWAARKPAVQADARAIRLTDDPRRDSYPRWTKDGRIRFLHSTSDKQMVSAVMNADGTNQTEITGRGNFTQGIWAPDETKLLFRKQGDNTSLYLADNDGSNEILLPFVPGNMDWSFDSQKIVYQAQVDGGAPDNFVYSLSSGKSENVTNDPGFDADPSFSPDGSQIVFATTRDGNAEIYLMNADGGNVRRLTDHPAWDSHPVFSPDGTTIAFSSDRDDENSDIYLMNVDGSGIRRLTDWKANESVEPGAWSPDGTQIAFTSDQNGRDDIYVISAEVYRPNLVLSDENSDLKISSPSPDGKTIAYQAEMSDKSGELRVLDLDSKQTRTILKTGNADIAPVFSPDGARIAFQNKIDSNTEICLINKDGSALTNLTNNAARDVNPAFSPDGKQVIFASNRDGNYGTYNLHIMDTDGANQRLIYATDLAMSITPEWSPDGRIYFANDKGGGAKGDLEIVSFRLEPPAAAEQRLTFRARADVAPAVSPDGRLIAFVASGDGNQEIYLMDSDGTKQLRITRNTAQDTSPRWSADGKRIIFTSNRDGRFAIYEVVVLP